VINYGTLYLCTLPMDIEYKVHRKCDNMEIHAREIGALSADSRMVHSVEGENDSSQYRWVMILTLNNTYLY
jgi:hypothetical protein